MLNETLFEIIHAFFTISSCISTSYNETVDLDDTPVSEDNKENPLMLSNHIHSLLNLMKRIIVIIIL